MLDGVHTQTPGCSIRGSWILDKIIFCSIIQRHAIAAKAPRRRALCHMPYTLCPSVSGNSGSARFAKQPKTKSKADVPPSTTQKKSCMEAYAHILLGVDPQPYRHSTTTFHSYRHWLIPIQSLCMGKITSPCHLYAREFSRLQLVRFGIW